MIEISHALSSALEIFSHFFIDPLFDEDHIDQEVEAVNNEYQNFLESNSWKILNLLKLQADKRHPYHYFDIGNTDTLKNIPESQNINIKEALWQFFEDHISSDGIAISIMANQDLDVLQKLAVQKFSRIPKRQRKIVEGMQYPAYTQNETGKFLWYQPKGNALMLELVFIIDEQLLQSKVKEKPLDFVVNLLNQNSKNGFKDFLKQEDWILDMDASSNPRTNNVNMFGISFTLTTIGFQNIIPLIQSFFAYLRFMKDNEVTLQNYKDVAIQSYLRFINQDNQDFEDVIDEISKKAKKIQNENDFNEFLITGQVFLRQSFDLQAIQFYLLQIIFIKFGTEQLFIKQFYLMHLNLQQFNLSYDELLIKNIIDSINPNNMYAIIQSDKLVIADDVEDFHFKQFDQQNTTDLLLQNITNIPKILDDQNNTINSNQTNQKQIQINQHSNIDQIESEKIQNNKKDGNEIQKNYTNLTKEINNLGQTNEINDDYNGPNFNEQQKLDFYDPVMKSHFSIKKINQYYLDLFENTKYDQYRFSKIQKNRFLPENLNLLSNCNASLYEQQNFQSIRKSNLTLLFNDVLEGYIQRSPKFDKKCLIEENEKDLAEDYPLQVYNDTFQELWVKPLRQTSEVVATIFLAPNYSDFMVGIQNYAKCQMLQIYFKNLLQRDFQDAFDTGYVISINDCVQLHFVGYQDKMGSLIIEVLKYIKDLPINEYVFNLAKDKTLNALQNNGQISATSQCKQINDQIIDSNYFPKDDQLIQQIQQIRLQQVIDYQKQLIKNLYLKTLFVGNINQDIASNITKSITELIQFDEIFNKNDTLPNKNIKKLSLENGLVFKKQNTNPSDMNHGILNYYQLGSYSVKNKVIIAFLKDYMDLQAYQYLRQQNQLGYSVFVQQSIFKKFVYGIQIGVQGSKFQPHDMDKVIEQFLEIARSYFESQSQFQIQKQLDNLKQKVTEDDTTQSAMSDRFWSKIESGSYDFLEKYKIESFIKSLDKSQILNAFDDLFKKQSRKLSVQVYSQSVNLSQVILNQNQSYSGKEEFLNTKISDFEILQTYDIN